MTTPSRQRPSQRGMGRSIDQALQEKLASLQAQAGVAARIQDPARCREDFEFFYHSVFVKADPVQFPVGIHQHYAIRFITWAGHHGVYPVNKLIVMPPGMGKSNIVSKALASWMVGREPESPSCLVTSASDLADERSLWLRERATSDWFKLIFPDVTPYTKQWKVDGWTLLPKGKVSPSSSEPTFRATGTDASIGGIRVKYAICDDLHNSTNSATDGERKRVKNWYFTQFVSRLANMNGWLVMLANIWHGDDLTSDLWESGQYAVMHMRALYESADAWADIYLPKELGDAGPAFAEHCEVARDDWSWHEKERRLRITMHRNGPSVWPEAYPVNKLRSDMRIMGRARFDRVWNGLRTDATGGFYKREWFKRWSADRPPTTFKYAIMSWDTTAETEDRVDYSGGSLIYIGDDGCLYVDKLIREKLDAGMSVPMAIATWWLLARLEGIEVKSVLLEKSTYARSSVQQIKRGWAREDFVRACRNYIAQSDANPTVVRMMRIVLDNEEALPDVVRIAGFKPLKVSRSGKKEVHEDAAPYWENGSVFHRNDMEYVETLEEELESFPSGTHDDLADCVAQAVREFYAVQIRQSRQTSKRRYIFLDIGVPYATRETASLLDGSSRYG